MIPLRPLLDRLPLIAALTPSASLARAMARRWARAVAAEPEIRDDIVTISGVFTAQPMTFQPGKPAELEPIDPLRLAYEAGRRDLALQLLALCGAGVRDLAQLTVETDHDPLAHSHDTPSRG